MGWSSIIELITWDLYAYSLTQINTSKTLRQIIYLVWIEEYLLCYHYSCRVLLTPHLNICTRKTGASAFFEGLSLSHSRSISNQHLSNFSSFMSRKSWPVIFFLRKILKSSSSSLKSYSFKCTIRASISQFQRHPEWYRCEIKIYFWGEKILILRRTDRSGDLRNCMWLYKNKNFAYRCYIIRMKRLL